MWAAAKPIQGDPLAGRYPAASWRPLGAQTQKRIIPRVLIFHTMAGYLAGTDATFRPGGYTGVEAHFGVGGPRDKGGLDGVVWQWQDIGYSADAQGDGNAYATSVETSDGTNPATPWSAKQLAALVDLTVWWCRQTGAPARLVASTGQSGIGYHSQFSAWNRNGHACPGSVRVKQLVSYVIPTARARLGGTTPAVPKPVPAPAKPAPAKTTTGGADMALTNDEITKIGAAVWNAQFGAVNARETAGARLAQAANADDARADIAALRAEVANLRTEVAALRTDIKSKGAN